MMSHALRRWPAFAWIPTYHAKRDLPADALAGITVAVMLIPQGMAYAMLAGLPPIMGLYASVLPLVAYALFGTSRQLSIGPVAMDSLLVATGASLVAPVGSPEFLTAAILLAGMVGVLQALMGLLRMGFLVNFLSRPVISGFTSAAAIIIGFSQLGHLIGVPLERSNQFHELLVGAASRLGEVHWPTLAVGLGSIAGIVLLRLWDRRLPGALIAVFVATALTFSLGLDRSGLSIVSEVPRGFPSIGLPTLDLAMVKALLPSALMIALVGFMEAISVAKALAARHDYEVDANRELIGLGAANFGAFLSGGYPVSGGFSRSAVNDQAGAKSPVAALVTAAVVALSLMLLTPLFYYLPKAVLAGIVMSAVFGLIDVEELIRSWKVRRVDAVLLAVTFAVTLFIGIAQGILVGVLASLGAFVHRSTRPHTAELGRLPGTNVFRNFEHFPEAEALPGVLVVRMDAAFYFANVSYFKTQLEHLLAHSKRSPHAHTVLLDCSSMNDLDTSAARALEDTVRSLRARGKDLLLANVKGPVRQVMRRSGLWDLIGSDHIYFDLARAAEAVARLRSRETTLAANAAIPLRHVNDVSDECDSCPGNASCGK